jgi:hypothetical protein
VAMADRAVVLHLGRVLAEGPPSEALRHPEVVAAYLGATADPSSAPSPTPSPTPTCATPSRGRRCSGSSDGLGASRWCPLQLLGDARRQDVGRLRGGPESHPTARS